LSQALADCAIEHAALGSADECAKDLGATNCSTLRAPGQLNCAELSQVYACAEYCDSMCTRAATCGPFDARLCGTGCILDPAICNVQSVAARSCEQIKLEARSYEDAARFASDEGDSVVIGSSSHGGAEFGLCESAGDCQAPLGCSPVTNTCASCTSDAECAPELGSRVYRCSSDQRCVEVECLRESDCFGRHCDTATNTCVRCRGDADCSSSFAPACKNAECVACTRDEHCANSFSGTKCDTGANSCVECLSNADCTTDAFPRCNTTTSSCDNCQSDADCVGRAVAQCNEVGECGATILF
jgi:hypothetical protein